MPWRSARGRSAAGSAEVDSSLNWNVSLKRAPIPYQILLTLVGGHKQIGGGTATLHDPFAKAATLVQGGEAVASSESSSPSGGVAQQIDSYWVAHRVG